jgi:molecular chaperone GrpE
MSEEQTTQEPTELEKLREENADLIDQLQRLQAEFINYRNRIEKEQSENKDAASDKLIKEFLPISDNLHLALQHAKDSEGNIKGEDLLTGLIMINEQMKQLLEHQGLEEIQAETFDPYKHEAVTQAHQEGAAKGAILQTYQRGYLKGGKVFRPAKVSVAK